jgi:hypothetical protein
MSDGTDLIIEMIRGDELPTNEFLVLGRRLQAAVATDASVEVGVSELELHGLPWWLVIHVWCISKRASERVAVLRNSVCEWAAAWRRNCPQRRPVQVTFRDATGVRLSALLVRERVRPLPTTQFEVRPRPKLLTMVAVDGPLDSPR